MYPARTFGLQAKPEASILATCPSTRLMICASLCLSIRLAYGPICMWRASWIGIQHDPYGCVPYRPSPARANWPGELQPTRRRFTQATICHQISFRCGTARREKARILGACRFAAATDVLVLKATSLMIPCPGWITHAESYRHLCVVGWDWATGGDAVLARSNVYFTPPWPGWQQDL